MRKREEKERKIKKKKNIIIKNLLKKLKLKMFNIWSVLKKKHYSS